MLLEEVRDVLTLELLEWPGRLLPVLQIGRTKRMFGAVVPGLSLRRAFKMDDLRVCESLGEHAWWKESFAAPVGQEAVHHVPLGMQSVTPFVKDDVHRALVAPMHEFGMLRRVAHDVVRATILPEEIQVHQHDAAVE